MSLEIALVRDLRPAYRRLVRTPVFALLAISMLALTFGAHLTIVGLIEAAFFRPLPVAEPERLFAVHERREGLDFYPMPFADLVSLGQGSRTFSDLAIHYSTAPLHVDLGEVGEVINGAVVSANYFSVLGIDPAEGRFFGPEEDRTVGTHPVVVLSHDFWQRRLGGTEDVLGSVVRVNDTALTVVGVAARGFVGTNPTFPCELFVPTMMAGTGYRWCDALSDPDCRIFEGLGRLAPAQDEAAARAEMEALYAPILADTVAALDADVDAVAERIDREVGLAPIGGPRSEGGSGLRAMATLLMAVVTSLVVLAAANLGGLLIGRALGRQKEIAVRLALGAPRRRVVSLFVAEALLVAAAGAVGGLLLTAWLGPLAGSVFGSGAPFEVRLGPSVLASALLLCLGTAFFAGWAPGLQSQRRLADTLKGAPGFGQHRIGPLTLLVVVQVAIAYVLLGSTGLLGHSLLGVSAAGHSEPGSVVTLRLRARLADYGPTEGQALIEEVVSRVGDWPEVRSVGFGTLLPLWPGYSMPLALPTAEANGTSTPPPTPARVATVRTAGVQAIGPGTLETFGLSLLAGRDFDDGDTVGSEPLVVVDRYLAESLWPGGEAVGRPVVLGAETHTVVGVVQDSEFLDRVRGRGARAYTAFRQDGGKVDARIAIRTHGDAAPLLPRLRRMVHALAPTVPVTEALTLEERLSEDLAPARMASVLTAIAGALAVLLCALGLGGVLALAVTRRVKEIGIRRALGAGSKQVTALIVRQALLPIGLALMLGFGVLLWVGPALGSFLYGIDPHDWRILGAAMVILAAVALLASWWPARRAARVDPIVALRQ